ncbi:hypothetical protein PO909_007490 [Leuciscus waleckii]
MHGCSSSTTEASGHQRVLNYIDDWLILAQSQELAVRHRDVVLAHIQSLGLRLNTKKSVLAPVQRTTFLGVVWDSVTMRAQLSPARIESILSTVTRINLGQAVTVKHFQRVLGLMAAASNIIPFGLLHMRALQWCLKTKGFSLKGNPFHMIRVTRRCLRSLSMWKKAWFLSQGPVLGASCRRKKRFDRRLPHGLVRSHGQPIYDRPMAGPSFFLAHKLPGNVGGVPGSEELPAGPQRSSCPREVRQYVSGGLYKPSRGSEVSPSMQTGTSDPPVVPMETVVSQSNIHPGESESGSRHPVEAAAEARGMETPPPRASDSEDFGPALTDDVIPPSGQDTRPTPAYTELIDVLSRATEKLSIDWPDEPRESQSSKLDERFLSGPNSRPEGRKLPFFSDLHHEISRSWKQPFSARLTNAAAADFTNLVGFVEQGYSAIPAVEKNAG